MSQQSNNSSQQRREFGAYLKDLRKRRHLTLEKVGSDLGISAGEISYIESGSRRSISDQLLIRLAERYGVPLGEMLMKKYWPQLPLLTGIVEPSKLVADLHKYLYPEEVEEVTRYLAFLLLKRAAANSS
jgi:transcriptional regulator with XRE-family HTH domain